MRETDAAAARDEMNKFPGDMWPPDSEPAQAPTPTSRCPRCKREVDPADLWGHPLATLRLIDPHSARYDRRIVPTREGIALCDACARQLDAIAREMDAHRRRLTRLWPTPTAHRGRLMDDQCLSRTFEAIRDTAIETVLGWAAWYDRRGLDASLVVYETGDWAVHLVPRGYDDDAVGDRGHLVVPIPVAPAAADASSADEDAIAGDADHGRGGASIRVIDLAALYRCRAPSDAAHEPLERALATRFYRALYIQTGDSA